MTMLDPLIEVRRVHVLVELENDRRYIWEAHGHPDPPSNKVECSLSFQGAAGATDISFSRLSHTIEALESRAEIHFNAKSTEPTLLSLVGEDEILVDPRAGDAVASVVATWERFIHQPHDELTRARILAELGDHMSDLASWVPEGAIE